MFGQRTQLWWDLPVKDSFEILQAMYKIDDRAYRRAMAMYQELLDLHEFLDTPVRKLSLGQRMRADLAAALLHDPPVLFLDEPTIGLDVVAKTRIRAFLKEVNETQKRRFCSRRTTWTILSSCASGLSSSITGKR